ncbi:hypothetical protein NDU88_001115 [Pleurodeles waltl]|uniref:Uncharacterized protein n=1 Tax=Pleurodeles waltl TaxID=8319 RepID=A0AAV7RBW7_PLEWA|nr:hypothetical protein NDU88_001115 [Pleurodeles waltl]
MGRAERVWRAVVRSRGEGRSDASSATGLEGADQPAGLGSAQLKRGQTLRRAVRTGTAGADWRRAEKVESEVDGGTRSVVDEDS